MAKSFENGFAQGKTEATLEGIADSVDAIFGKLDRLPCSEHWGLLSSLKTSQKYLWALMLVVFGTVAGLLLKSLFG